MSRSTDPDVVLLHAAADPTRLRMLRQLSVGGEVCACDFATDAGVSQPTVSHHLRVLREAGWVKTERRGTWIWYSLRPEAAARFGGLARLFVDAASPDDARRPVRGTRLPVVDPAAQERPVA